MSAPNLSPGGQHTFNQIKAGMAKQTPDALAAHRDQGLHPNIDAQMAGHHARISALESSAQSHKPESHEPEPASEDVP